MKKKVLFVTTHPLLVETFLEQIIGVLCTQYKVHLAVNLGEPRASLSLPSSASITHVDIARQVSVFRDVKTLFALLRLIRKEHFDMVHTVAPKAGLLGITAAVIARVPIRLHTFQGEVWATHHGIWRMVLKFMDRLTAFLATHILVVSKSERRFLIDERVISGGKTRILANGSICGVDLQRFRPDLQSRRTVRRDLEVSDHETLFLYVGRLTREKGVLDLIKAFVRISQRRNDCHLLIVGPDESNLTSQILSVSNDVKRYIHMLGYTREPERYMAAAEVICLPSYREGFGMTLIEAAAIGVPAIASRIYGIMDAVKEGSTGLLHTPGNIDEIESLMIKLANDKVLRARLGEQARGRVNRYFSQKLLLRAYLDYYAEILR